MNGEVIIFTTPGIEVPWWYKSLENVRYGKWKWVKNSLWGKKEVVFIYCAAA